MRQEAEFQAFYAANYGRILAMATAMVGDRLQAEDVAQEAFARAYSRWGRIGHYEVPEAWVRQVAMRLAVDAGRRMRRTIGLRLRLAAQRRPAAPEPGSGLAFTALGSALRALPLREREVIVLHYLADLPVETIARERGMPAGTVKTRLAAGRRHLEAALTDSTEAVRDAG